MDTWVSHEASAPREKANRCASGNPDDTQDEIAHRQQRRGRAMPADRPDDGHMDLVMTKTRQPPADPLRARGLAEERPADAAQADTTTATGAPAMDRHVGRRARRPMQSTCPDLAYRLGAIVLDEAKADAICNAPVAQKPTLTTKKQVHMLEDGAYKGPYDVNLQAEAVRVTRTLYREYVLSKLWGDTIVAHHVPVFDEARGVIYLRAWTSSATAGLVTGAHRRAPSGAVARSAR
jgi:hypothetical protein